MNSSKSVGRISISRILGLFGLMLCFSGIGTIRSRRRGMRDALNLALDYRDWLVPRRSIVNSWAAIYPPLYHLSLIPRSPCIPRYPRLGR